MICHKRTRLIFILFDGGCQHLRELATHWLLDRRRLEHSSFLRHLFLSNALRNTFCERISKGNSQSHARNSFHALTTTVCAGTDALRKSYRLESLGDENNPKGVLSAQQLRTLDTFPSEGDTLRLCSASSCAQALSCDTREQIHLKAYVVIPIKIIEFLTGRTHPANSNGGGDSEGLWHMRIFFSKPSLASFWTAHIACARTSQQSLRNSSIPARARDSFRRTRRTWPAWRSAVSS